MADTHEEVLQRLLVAMSEIPNIRHVARNELDVPETKLPAMLLFDGDEETEDVGDVSMRSSHKPIIVHMTPEIVVISQAREAGSDISTLRARLINKILLDDELNTIVGTGRQGNGAIRWDGEKSDFGYGRSLQGAMMFFFTFTYPLIPDRL